MDEAQGWPLEGLRVVDLSTEIAGPYASKLLLDAGAEVVKVEPPGGDPLRRWSASGARPEGEDGALFRFLNASKRSICLDPASEADRETLLALATRADVVLQSGAPGDGAPPPLGFEALQARDPAVSLLTLTPWGTSGPWAERPASEFTLQAATGSTGYRGLPDRKPVAAGGRIGEWAAGSFAAVGALAAWLSARRTGAGQHVDVSVFEAMVLCLTIYPDLMSQWVDGPLPRSIELPSVEPAKDGWVGFCTITGQQWLDFCALLGRPDVGEDERFLDGRRRMEHLDFMQELIHGWTRERSVEEIVELANLMRIPAAPVGDGRSLPQMDHLVERRVFAPGPHGFLQPRIPYRLEQTPLRPFGAAPAAGQHDAEVRAELATPAPARPAPEGGGALPLAGVRVVDFTAFWAGPFTTACLADLGADVVKIESIQRPDGMRFAGAARTERMWEWSPVFHGANVGKRAVTLDLDSDDGRALLRRMVEGADVVIENYSVRVLEHFGLGWDAIHAWNPRAIMLRMPAFGLDGPWRDRPGFAMTVEQVSGMAWVTGYPDLPLVVRGACDPIGGMHALVALVGALEHRRRSGEGQLVEVPLLEVAVNLAAEQVIEYSAYGELLTRDENRGPVAAPQGVYRCAGDDTLVAVAVASDAHWQGLRRALGDPDWARDEAFATAAGRRAQHDALDERIEAWTSQRSLAEAEETLVSAGVPAHAVVNAHFVMPNPQLEQREFFQVLKHPVTGETRYPGLPMRFSALGPHLHRAPPPTLGQHNDEILRGELGLSDEELARLREARCIGDRPTFM